MHDPSSNLELKSPAITKHGGEGTHDDDVRVAAAAAEMHHHKSSNISMQHFISHVHFSSEHVSRCTDDTTMISPPTSSSSLKSTLLTGQKKCRLSTNS
jgi:hypothetical protein